METAIKWPKMPKHQNAKNTLEHASTHTTARAHGILVHAHLITLLASNLRLKILVVNSVKHVILITIKLIKSLF